MTTACKEMNTTGTDENLFRLVPVFGRDAWVLPLELVPMPWHCPQICARAPTKGYVQPGVSAWAPSLNGALHRQAIKQVMDV